MPRTANPRREPASSRKRASVVDPDSDEHDTKRSRGRPRLDTKDETAAERRRTQIRLAQRAYRNRKDTAIATLEQKVKDLEQTNDDMSREFLGFHDLILSQGLLQDAPEVARKLNDSTRKFLSLARKPLGDSSRRNSSTSNEPSDSTDTVSGQINDWTGSTGSPRSADNLTAEPTIFNTRHDLRTSTTIDQARDTNAQITPPPRVSYEIIAQPTIENASFPVYDTQTHAQPLANSFTPPVFASMPSPSSYASHERSFGRRLQRAAVEAGLRLASMVNPPPHHYAAVFGFCLLFEPKDAIIRRLSAVVNKSSRESLNNWRYPFTNLGGAGTFQLNHDAGSTLLENGLEANHLPIGNQGLLDPYRPPEMTGSSMGPFDEGIESARDDHIDRKMRMMYKGFEGDFYDADEVEIYLRQRGIIIPESSDFVDAEIDLGAFDMPSDLGRPQGHGTSAFSGDTQAPGLDPGLLSQARKDTEGVRNLWAGAMPPMTTEPITSSTLDSPLNINTMDSHIGCLTADITTAVVQQFSVSMGGVGDLSGRSSQIWGSSWMKTKVAIDVNRLVADLTGMAVCLGRTPGLRLKDINTAVRAAIVLTGH